MDVALTLEAATPLALRSGRNTEEGGTLRYIPGAVLLGGLAEAHQRLRPGATDEFAAFFLTDQISMGNGYPATFPPRQDALRNPASLMAPLPMTARSCKRWSGFRYQSDDDHTYHGVSDHLLLWILFALSEETHCAPVRAARDCPDCGQAMDAVSGYYRWGFTPEEIGRAEEAIGLQSHTGINRATGIVQESILFTQQVLIQGSTFQAHLRIHDDLVANVQEFIEEVSHVGLWRVGTSRTRGLGLLQVMDSIQVDDNADIAGAVDTRVEEFDQIVRRRALEYGISTPHARYVPITLHSDLLLPDRLLHWRTRLDEHVLADYGLAGAHLVYHAAHLTRVMGWNAVLGLPRPDALAIARGSVFVFAFDGVPDSDALVRLQNEGVGVRKDGGFGRLVVADRFHWEVDNA